MWWLVSAMAAQPGTRLTVKVVDDTGSAVGTARVRIDDEGMRHRVNPRTGRWKGETLYPDGQQPQPLAIGELVQITALAPGHLPRTIHYRLRVGRNVVEVPLQPYDDGAAAVDTRSAGLLGTATPDCDRTSLAVLQGSMDFSPEAIQRLGDLSKADPELTAGFSTLLVAQGTAQFESAMAWADIAEQEAYARQGDDFVSLIESLYRSRSVAHHVRWMEAEERYLAAPNHENEVTLHTTRDASAGLAEEWVAWAASAGRSAQLAQSLCLSASDQPERCLP